MSKDNKRVFDHVVIIMFENEYRSYVMENPFMAQLATQGLDLSNYFGVKHPSHTNYIATISGETWNTVQDPLYYSIGVANPIANPPAPLAGPTVVDQLVESGLNWKAYMETLSTVDWPPTSELVMDKSNPKLIDLPATVKNTILDYPPYLNVHNPFVRFKTILENQDQWERIGNAYDFLRDVLDGTLPEYAWFTPDIWSDGHWLRGSYSDGGSPIPGPCFAQNAPFERAPVLVNQLAKWLENFFSVLRFPGPESRLPANTLVVVTFDESDFEADYTTKRKEDARKSTYEGPNQIYTVLLGDTVEAGTAEDEGYNHYSLLKTIEKNFNLASLGKNDTDSNWFQFLWGQKFRWGSPQETPIVATAGIMASAGLEDALYLVYRNDDCGGLSYSVFHGDEWSDAQPVPTDATAIALAACGEQLILVAQNNRSLTYLTYDLKSGWAKPSELVAEATGALGMTAFVDYDAGVEKVMVAYRTADRHIWTMVYSAGQWSTPVDIGHKTDGEITLAAIGPSLYLIHKTVGKNTMDVVSYNTAPFNVVKDTSDDSNDMTLGVFSPSEYPVAHFAHGPNPLSPGEDEPLIQPYLGSGPLAAAALDGVIHFAHPSPDMDQVQTETFSIAGVMTPLKKVDYRATTKSASAFATLAEDISSRQTGIDNPKSSQATNNGFGTLAEAGWSQQKAIDGVEVSSGNAMSMTRVGSTLALLFQPPGSKNILISRGGYSRS